MKKRFPRQRMMNHHILEWSVRKGFAALLVSKEKKPHQVNWEFDVEELLGKRRKISKKKNFYKIYSLLLFTYP